MGSDKPDLDAEQAGRMGRAGEAADFSAGICSGPTTGQPAFSFDRHGNGPVPFIHPAIGTVWLP